MIYTNIKHDIVQCKNCPLSKDLDYGCNPQWGAGNKSASILVLNFRTSQESHLVEKPVETKYSLLLRKILETAKLSDTDVFVTNLIKCKSNMVPVKTFRTNLNTCKNSWLDKELECLVNIKSIICFGAQTASYLLDKKSLTVEGHTNHMYKSYPIYTTYSFEEIFRKGEAYINHAIETFKNIKENHAKIKETR